MNTEITTQKIGPSLEAAAAEAFGGVAARPPQPGLTAARVAPAPAAELAPIGHPTFDSTPAEILLRRQAVDGARTRLGGLIRHVTAECAALNVVIDALAADESVKGEGFDPAAARKFLADLGKVISNLSAPAKPSKKAAA